MKKLDCRTNKTNLYIIVEDSCSEGITSSSTYVFDDEDLANSKFKELVKNDKFFLNEENRDDVINEGIYWYESYPDGEYMETHYCVKLLDFSN